MRQKIIAILSCFILGALTMLFSFEMEKPSYDLDTHKLVMLYVDPADENILSKFASIGIPADQVTLDPMKSKHKKSTMALVYGLSMCMMVFFYTNICNLLSWIFDKIIPQKEKEQTPTISS